MIDGGELKTKPTKMEVITKWKTLINSIELKSFVGEPKYLQKII
jgi:hypothetical protein